ncbi:MAG TPA: CHASE sensor domain-containing protein, partial [Rhodocyclaceae bacterium]
MTKTADHVVGVRRLTTVWISAVTLMMLALVALQSYLEGKQLVDTVVSTASVVSGNAAAAVVFNDTAAASEMLAAFHASDT